jgi:acyl-CoA thioesterase II
MVTTDAILRSLEFTPAGPGSYTAGHAELGHNVVFGGQLMAQAIVAAAADHPGKVVKTLHTVFARAASPSADLDVSVETIHSGRALAGVTVTFMQGDRICTRAQVLLSADEPDFIHHADPSPSLGTPPAWGAASGEWEFDVVGGVDVGDPEAVGPPDLAIWTRFDGAPDDPIVNQALLAFGSESFLIGTAMRPHPGVGQSQAHVTLSTGVVSHTMTFHRPVLVRDWTLIAFHSAFAGGGRCYGRGDCFTADGTFVASLMQDAMIRPMADAGPGARL